MQVRIEITADGSDERASRAVDVVLDMLAGQDIAPAAPAQESSEARVLTEMAAELEQTRERLHQTERELQESTSRLTDVHTELKKSRTRSSDREKTVAALRKTADQVSTRHQSVVEGLETRISQLEEQLATAKKAGDTTALRQEITSLKAAAKKTAANHGRAVESLQDRITALEAQLAEARGEVDEWVFWAEAEGIEFVTTEAEEDDGQ